MGADTKKGQLKTDFTIKEKLLNQPANRPILKSYTRYYDLPEGIQLKVYKLEEIFIEKYLCILDRMEPRDVYDLWYLAANQCLEFGHLAPKIKEKAIAKGSKYIDILSSLNKKRKNYETLWEARLKDQMIDLEHFDKVYRELTRALKPINILE